MPARRKTVEDMKEPKDKLLPRLTAAFFDRPRATVLLWLVLTIFGIFSYTTFLSREGFPSINVPFAIVNGTYFVNDPAKVDNDVTKTITEIAAERSDVNLVQGQSTDNFFVVQLEYIEGTDSNAATKAIEQAVRDSGRLPANAQVKFDPLYFGATGGMLSRLTKQWRSSAKTTTRRFPLLTPKPKRLSRGLTIISPAWLSQSLLKTISS